MLEKLLNLFKKYREQIAYLFFGGLTTLVSIGSFSLFYYFILKSNNLASNVISEIIAITFAYVTNKLFVFNSKTSDFKSFLIEIISFYGVRTIASLLNVGAMYLLVDVLLFNALVCKIIVTVIIIVLNYVFSKLFVFKKANQSQVDEASNEWY